MNRNKYVFFLVLFFSKLLHTIALRLNLHSMLQFILRTSPWYCVLSHDCIVPCCLCCLIVVMCHHKITHTHMHALACAHTHTHTLSLLLSLTYTYTPGNIQYTSSDIYMHIKYQSIYTEQTLGGYFGFILIYCSLAHILVIG